MNTPIYLDYAATTPVDPQVAARMAEHLTRDGVFANPASTHAPGRMARAAVEQARAEVAALLNCTPAEIIFTSGATEADNLAIKGAARFHAARGRHLVTAKTEHKAVLDTCKALEQEGFTVTWLTPEDQGRVTPGQLAAALRPDTVLVSLMHANNETGVLNDIAALGALCRERGVLFHVDAAQSVGKVPVDLGALPVDLLSLSAHKFYGPKGVGALFVRQQPRALLAAQIHGGGHERGLRSGTLATHQLVGLGAASALAAEQLPAEGPRLAALREQLWAGLADIGLLNGHPTARLPGILNISFPGVEGESLLLALADLAVSSGAACNSATAEPSYVLRALGRDDVLAQSALRFSLGRWTTADEVASAVDRIKAAVARLRALAPPEVTEKQGNFG